MGEAIEETICDVWFATAAFEASFINGWVESILVTVQDFVWWLTMLWNAVWRRAVWWSSVVERYGGAVVVEQWWWSSVVGQCGRGRKVYRASIF